MNRAPKPRRASPRTSVPARRSWRGFLGSWLPVVLWMAIIFGFSTDMGSSRRTSRLIGPFLRWIYPGISDEAVSRVQFGVRKGAHMTEYALLALLSWRAIRRTVTPPTEQRPAWQWGHAAAAVALAALFAGSDEWHQSTIPSRQGQFSDVLIDFTGAVLAMIVLWRIGRRLKRW